MSRDSLLKLAIIVCVIALNVVLMSSRGIQVPRTEFAVPAAAIMLLTVFGLFYRWRRVDSFVMCLLGLGHVVVFTSAYTLLMYSAGTFSAPLTDQYLVHFDHACGISLPAIVAWAQAHPTITGLLKIAYDSLLLQTALVVIVLGMTGRRVPLEQFVLQFILTALLTVLGFVFFPAIGPFESYGYAMDASQERYVEHLMALRAGEMSVFTLSGAEGLITWPSFHTTWAILLAWAFRRHKWLFAPAIVVNLAVIASTMTTGWHYFADVVAGAAVAVAAIWMTTLTRHWFYTDSEDPILVSGDPFVPALAAEPELVHALASPANTGDVDGGSSASR